MALYPDRLEPRKLVCRTKGVLNEQITKNVFNFAQSRHPNPLLLIILPLLITPYQPTIILSL